jgi:hypothetical protein
VLVDGESFDRAEAAEILGVAPDVLDTRLQRARTTLRQVVVETVADTDREPDRDPDGDDGVVRTALGLLPIPAHGPDFWGRLDAAIEAIEAPDAPTIAEPAAALPDVPEEPEDAAPDPARAFVPRSLRSLSNALLVVLAVAALVVVAVATSRLLEDPGPGATDTPTSAPATPPGP